MEYPKVRAPQLPNDPARWLNTNGQALQIERGYVYVLDFWTYGCINCLHVLPDLKYLEDKYRDAPVRVIGIHSPKFDTEKAAAGVEDATRRCGITHPVLRDDDHFVWHSYAARAWPTLIVVDPAGYVVGYASGEGKRDLLDGVIRRTLEEFAGKTAAATFPFLREQNSTAAAPLRYPGKVLADDPGGRLFLSDTGHNRVVVTRLDGTLLDVIGGGEAGRQDGGFATAQFRGPQGLALVGPETLYVADTENHLIRRVDLRDRTVTTAAGTGTQALGHGSLGGAALSTALNSPWDLWPVGDTLYVAMAGPHQIWRYQPRSGSLAVFAGTGEEARGDGPAAAAAFAQPSGLTSDGDFLYVADSETSAIRRVSLSEDPVVRTLAGGDLFAFGDADGRGDLVRLQHPLGVLWVAGQVWIADTYNHKVKRLDPQTRAVVTVAGTGVAGHRDGPSPEAEFSEPGGLASARGRVYVADTNSHAIRTLDPATGVVGTLPLAGLCAPGVCVP